MIEESNGAIIVTGKEDIRVTALLTLAHGIVLEMTSGLKPSRNFSALNIARHHGLVAEGTKPQKKKLLRLTVQAIREAKPGWEPSEYIAKALVK